MNRDEMSYEQAKKWILANYFDGDEDVRAFVAGDEETMAMVRAVEALSSGSNIDQESEDDVKETWYHFIFNNDTFYDMTCAVSFKDAIWEMAKYHNDASEIFRKCLNGFDESDINGIVQLFNHFYHTPIGEIYVVEKAIYPSKE